MNKYLVRYRQPPYGALTTTIVRATSAGEAAAAFLDADQDRDSLGIDSVDAVDAA